MPSLLLRTGCSIVCVQSTPYSVQSEGFGFLSTVENIPRMLLLDTTASDLIMQKMSIKLLDCILTSLRVLSSVIYTFRTEYAGLIHGTGTSRSRTPNEA